LEIKAAKKITYDVQNFNNYAMKTAITFVNEKYIPQESCQLLMENETIEEIQIIRTKLYFSEPKKNGQQYYSCECNQINPEKSPPTNSDLKEIIVVDVGVSLIFENKQVVNFFINDNDDDFYSNENSTQKEDFKKELEQKYQFVDLK
jgi:hypothetical protein